MSYVRRIKSETSYDDRIIRRYEVERPDPYANDYYWEDSKYELSMFDKLVELELHIDKSAAKYFEDSPYALADAVWTSALIKTFDGMHFEPWWRFKTTVLWYRMEIIYYTMEEKDHWGPGPLPIAVDFWGENHPFYGSLNWDRRNQYYNTDLDVWLPKDVILTPEREQEIRRENEGLERRKAREEEIKRIHNRKSHKYFPMPPRND